MACLFTVEKCQGEGENKPYGFNWTILLAKTWSANMPFEAGARVRPTTEELQTGFEYNSSGGQTNGKKEPKWPTTLGGTVVDGSITWTAVALSTASLLETIASSAWAIHADLTGSGEATVNTAGQQSTEVSITGGTVDEAYTIVNEITTSEGNEYQAQIVLTIEE